MQATIDRDLSWKVDPANFAAKAQISFSAHYFEHATVAAQPFSDKWEFCYRPTQPGFYDIHANVKNGDSLTLLRRPFTYIAPDKVYALDDRNEEVDFVTSLSKARKRNYKASYRAAINGQDFDFIYFPSREERLYVLCPSAIIRGQFPVPYFYRWQWANDGYFPGNVIVVSDPTFNLDPALGAGWLIGEADKDATKNFAKIISLFSYALKIPFREITFWGSSAGGFIAIQLSAYFPRSSAVAVNAQTDVYKFDGHQLLYKKGFPGLTESEINAQYGPRLRLAENLERLAENHIFIAQNITDTHHYEEHFKPFLKEIPDNSYDGLKEGIWHDKGSPFTFWLYSQPGGHTPETMEMGQLMLQKLELQKRFGG